MLFRSRFSNEINFVRSAGGVIIRVRRGEDPTKEELSKMHISETAWNSYVPDRTILNDKDIEGLKLCVKDVLTDLEKGSRIHYNLTI